MIVVISGTNRLGSNTLKVSRLVESLVREQGEDVFFIDLHKMPHALYDPVSYTQKPPEFAPYQQAILEARGILTVLPEYNGSYPGALKYFIDMLKFPESLAGVPAGFVGVSSGEWGALRPVEQLEMVFQYRSAHLYGKRVFIKNVRQHLDAEGHLQDAELTMRLSAMVKGFVDFSRAIRPS